MSEKIIQLTEKLLHYNRLFLKIYQDAREKGTKQDFQDVIKPFSNEVKGINDVWREKMKGWVHERNHKHIHLSQINTTSDYIEQLSIQSFFPETSRSRFINTNRTVEYFLLEILKEI